MVHRHQRRRTPQVGLKCPKLLMDEGGDLVTGRGEHLLGRSLFETGPAEVILAFGEDRVSDGFLGAVGFLLLQGVEFVQPLDEQEIGQLLDNGKRVGNSPGPHGVPDAVDFGFCFAGDHLCFASLFGSLDFDSF